MSKKRSQAVEILPSVITERVFGSIKDITFRITKNGSNIAMPKVKQPNKTGGDPIPFKKCSEKWSTLTVEQKKFWDEIVKQKGFWSRWTAFTSSFLLSVGIHGLEETMLNDLQYHDSQARFRRYDCYRNSAKRNSQYKVNRQDYARTAETCKRYQVQLDSDLLFVKLLNLTDVNNALAMELIYRTDPIVEYQYFPEEKAEVEKGTYIKSTRARVGAEKYELI